MKREKGVVSPMIILGVITAVLLLVVGILYRQVTTLNVEKGKLSGEVETANDTAKTLNATISGQKNTIDTLTAVNTTITEEYKALAVEKNQIEKDLENVKRHMPKTLPATQVNKKTAEQDQNTRLRIELAWGAYCSKAPSDTRCQPKEQ